MDRLHNPFKQALKSGRLQIGLWHSLSSHLVAEVLADSGFDWILEHRTVRLNRRGFRWG